MKFGIFYELQLPRPWEPGGEQNLYQNALTELEVADRLGYDYAWVVEHHFLEEYSHCPVPEAFLGAASQRLDGCWREKLSMARAMGTPQRVPIGGNVQAAKLLTQVKPLPDDWSMMPTTIQMGMTSIR